MWTNEGTTDRVVRVIIGIVLLYLGWSGTVGGTAGTVLKWLGFVPLLTGLIGFCALYRILGINTSKPAA
jgi:hypothetical protein